MSIFKHLLRAAAAALALGGAAGALAADAYPARPVKIVLGYVAGGGADAAARIIGKALGDELGQPFVVENKPGASGVIAVSTITKSAPDGYSLLLISAGEMVQPVLRQDLPYDFAADLAPVSFVGVSPFVLTVHPDVPAKTVAELVAYAKSAPGKVNFGSSGVGTSPHLAGELFSIMSGARMTHIPYKGGAQAAAATLAGEIQVSFPAATSAMQLVQAGKLRALAVTTLKRTAFMPQLPTLDELGLTGFDRSSWYALMAPSGTPRAVVEQLNGAVSRALARPEVRRQLEEQGIEPGGGSPERLRDMVRSELKVNAEIVRQAGLKAQ